MCTVKSNSLFHHQLMSDAATSACRLWGFRLLTQRHQLITIKSNYNIIIYVYNYTHDRLKVRATLAHTNTTPCKVLGRFALRPQVATCSQLAGSVSPLGDVTVVPSYRTLSDKALTNTRLPAFAKVRHAVEETDGTKCREGNKDFYLLIDLFILVVD